MRNEHSAAEKIKEISGTNPLKCRNVENVLLPVHPSMKWISNHISLYPML